MKNLWAPWRLEYVKGERPEGCVLCAASAKRPGESLVLFSGSLSLAILNKYPYNNGHVMVSPKRHIPELESLSVEESYDLLRLVRHSVAVLKKAYRPDGFNIGLNLGRAAGAGIEDHLHWHIVPRWSGDTNFMPALAEVRVVPEHIQQTLSELLPGFKSIA